MSQFLDNVIWYDKEGNEKNLQDELDNKYPKYLPSDVNLDNVISEGYYCIVGGIYVDIGATIIHLWVQSGNYQCGYTHDGKRVERFRSFNAGVWYWSSWQWVTSIQWEDLPFDSKRALYFIPKGVKIWSIGWFSTTQNQFLYAPSVINRDALDYDGSLDHTYSRCIVPACDSNCNYTPIIVKSLGLNENGGRFIELCDTQGNPYDVSTNGLKFSY